MRGGARTPSKSDDGIRNGETSMSTGTHGTSASSQPAATFSTAISKSRHQIAGKPIYSRPTATGTFSLSSSAWKTVPESQARGAAAEA